LQLYQQAFYLKEMTGLGGLVDKFAYFIGATHKWHLSKYIFHTFHTLSLSLFPRHRIAGGKKAYFKCGTSCASNREPSLQFMYYMHTIHTYIHTYVIELNREAYG